MAASPYAIFTQHCNPDGALTKLQELLPDAAVTRDDDGQWTRVKGTWKRGWLKSALTLTVNHNRDHYAGPGWPRQVDGMAGYFGKFPDAKRRPDLFGYLPGLTFLLGFTLDPGPADDDPRQQVILDMAHYLDGVIFQQGCLLDSQGRTIVSEDGESDPEAVLPKHEPAHQDVEQSIVRGSSEEEEECEPPDAERVLARLTLMTALVNRGFIETSSSHGMEQTRREMVEAISEHPAWDEAEPWETEALETPVGGLDDKVKWKLPWLSEGATVLAWALELAEIPPYDRQVDTSILYDLEKKVRDQEPGPPLRPLSDLQVMAFQMLAIHGRLRQFYVKREAMDFVAYAPKAWCGPMDISLARIAENDLEVNGKPISKAGEDQWKIASGIMEERRQAINWLLGHHPVYSEVDTGT